MQIECGKWGNSLGIRIPKKMAEAIGFEAGSLADLNINNGTLVIRPLKAKPKLKDLLESLKAAGGREEEIDFGTDLGREDVPW